MIPAMYAGAIIAAYNFILPNVDNIIEKLPAAII